MRSLRGTAGLGRQKCYDKDKAKGEGSLAWPVVSRADKLERATLDALTSVIFANDVQVVRVTKEKSIGDCGSYDSSEDSLGLPQHPFVLSLV
jgi:hypothetical protein